MCFFFFYLSIWKVTTPEPEVELTEADLPGLQEAVARLQKEYDDAVVVKNNLGNDVKSCSERLKAATGLLNRYICTHNNHCGNSNRINFFLKQ